MRMRIQIGALLLALLLPGCASFQGRVGRDPQPPGIDQAVVESLVCRGALDEAARYVEARGGAQADRTERIERARHKAKDDPSCCPLGACPAAGGK